MLEKFTDYSFDSLRKDINAGLIVGIIAIPLGMAFAIASGVKPEYGIYTTIIAGLVISMFGGSRFQISGPTGAFIPVLLGIVMHYGYGNLLIAGVLSGILLILMGVFRLGVLIKYIPRPVVIGFTSGIAVIIFSGQIPNFLGLEIEKHESFLLNIREMILNMGSTNIYSLIIAVLSLVVIILTPKLSNRIPGPIVGLIVATVVSFLFFNDKVGTIRSVYGEIPNSLPSFELIDISLEKIQLMMKPAFTIAILGAIESLLSAVIADGMTGTKHNSNKELIGQGIGNIMIPFFGGIPATGAIARTATNIKSGGVSPVSGIVHSVVVLMVLLLFAPYASYIPLAGLAPILMLVAWNMSERKHFMHILKTKTGDSLILIITFFLTIFTDLTTAVEFGLIFAIILFVKRMSELMTISKVLPDHNMKNEKLVPGMVYDGHDCPQFSIYTIDGPLFFGVAGLFTETIMKAIHYKPKILLLRMGNVPLMDTTGESNLQRLVDFFRKNDGLVVISEIQQQPKDVLLKSGLFHMIGEENFYQSTEEAIRNALTKVEKEKCRGCNLDAFRECSQLSKQGSVEELQVVTQ